VGPPASGPPPPPFDLAGWLGRQNPDDPGNQPKENRHGAGPAVGAAPVSSSPVSPSPGRGRPAKHAAAASSAVADDRLKRARAYLAKVPAGVAGQGGHNRTFHAACVLIQGFDLTVDQARPLFSEWNLGCIPPWSPAELEHKLSDAAKAIDSRPRGYLCDGGSRASGDRAGRVLRPPGAVAHQPPDRSGPPCEMECPPGQEANPHRLAQLFLSTSFVRGGELAVRFWRDEFHAWDGAAYRPVPASEIRAQLTRSIAAEFFRLYRLALGEGHQTGGPRGERPGAKADRPGDASARSRPQRPIPVTSRLVCDVLQALASLVMVSTRDVPAQPAWIEELPADQSHANSTPPWLAEDVLPAKNVLVHLPSLFAGAACAIAPTPRFFNAFALEYDFDPIAPVPERWLGFLNQIWEDDVESIACLQEWFGYLLTPDTRQQKILMMVGPKRSGRGTIARVLKALAGSNSVVNPTLATLARPFGLSTLIGKPIAVFPDARLSSRPDNAAIVECLLSISGEDDQTIDRKHLPAWSGKLPTRFVLISNELPRLRDASGALTGRLIMLRFIRSFFGQEDMALFERIKPELPGILRWAIDGWQRLNQRGRFTQPRSARELVAAMDDLASPIAAFLRDRCIVERDATCPVAALYESWRSWCLEHGRDAVGDEHSFGRDLHAAIPALSSIRPRSSAGRPRLYEGIRLRNALDPDPEPSW
jgi:putative DNA primase/helicase